MAVWEARRQVTAAKWWNTISQVSWTDWVTQDVYYWLDHSFQYSSNINCDDELHWIKLATRTAFTNSYSKCQLVSLWEHWVMALPITSRPWDEIDLKRFQFNWYYDSDWDERPDWPLPLNNWEPVSKWTEFDNKAWTLYATAYKWVPWVVFQNRFWYGGNLTWEDNWYLFSVPLAVAWWWHWADQEHKYLPYDHNDYTDDSIEDKDDIVLNWDMKWRITAILNYNNTRLVVACGNEIWVYYPELDTDRVWTIYWKTWWKKVLDYEAWVVVVALTCTFEYLKVWAVDEWWNTKVYYYQGNNNLRSTFVYNVVDLTGVRVLHVYSINWIDYYTSSIWEYASDALINFNKMIWATPVKLFSQRAGMTVFDVNNKAPYFVWPTSISWAYNDGNIYVADAYGVFKFRYNPQWFDKGYMKWRLNNNVQVYWLCENKGILYVSTEDWCYAMRLYDTWVDWYQEQWVLISREFEWREWGTVTKMLDEIRMNFELNPLTNYNGTIDIYVSPNNLWKSTSSFTKANNWYHAMHITQDSAGTRTEKSNLLNDLAWSGSNKDSSFKFDWQTITYAVVITRYTPPANPSERQEEAVKATPIVRELNIRYHCKDKTNNVYDIN